VRILRRLLGAAALLIGAAVPAGLAPPPAHADGGCGTQGVAVVVDFGALGGGVKQSCVNGGGKAAALFVAAGHSLGRVQSQPSAVCDIDGQPSAPCPQMPPANAYWGLFWTSGSSAHWTYASLGVDALTVPAGGSLAFAWQSAAGTRSPGVAAVVTRTSTPTAKPTKKAKQKTTHKSDTTRKTPAAKPSATSTPSASESVSVAASASAIVSPSAAAGMTSTAVTPPVAASAMPTDPATGSTDAATTSADSAPSSTDAGGGLPGWVAPVAVVVVLAAGGGVAVGRRRTRG
jgi:hypothetical protein